MTSTAWRHEATGGDLCKGFAAGLVGGLAATWVMTLGMAAQRKVERRIAERSERRARQRAYQHAWSAAEGHAGGEDQERPHDPDEAEPATQKVAEAVSEGVFHRELSEEEKRKAGPVVHYAFGATMGGLYGAVAELLPSVTIGAGLPFGAGFWLVAEEIVVPALGLTPPPHRVPVKKHALGLGGHLLYGGILEGVRRLVRSQW